MEDRRGQRSGIGFPGRGRRLRLGRKSAGGGIGTIVIVLVAMYFGVDPAMVLQMTDPGGGSAYAPTQSSQPLSAEQKRLGEFVSVVLADTEDSWHVLFQQQGGQYKEPKLVLFTDFVRSACGSAQSAMGPFYCPGDQKIYIDLSFYADLKRKYGAPGDFAQAYVIAHEVGHHVQNLLGISGQVHRAKQNLSRAEANQLSVRLELQADCLAGLWAQHADRARNILESGDVEEALNAASSIGDDRLQQQAQGRITPESFTHGTSQQRMRWFNNGMQAGSMSDCDTFNKDAV